MSTPKTAIPRLDDADEKAAAFFQSLLAGAPEQTHRPSLRGVRLLSIKPATRHSVGWHVGKRQSVTGSFTGKALPVSRLSPPRPPKIESSAKPREPDEIIRDRAASLAERTAALHHALHADELADATVQAIVSELRDTNQPLEWVSYLLEAAEFVDVQTPQTQESLKLALRDRLLPLASVSGQDAALWSAVRRYGSLIKSVTEAQALLPLLEAARPLATQQVAIQTLQSVFTRAYHADADIEQFAERSREILERLLALSPTDRSPEQDALLMNALVLSATLDDKRALTAARSLAEQAAPRFRRFIASHLTRAIERLHACARPAQVALEVREIVSPEGA